jgi:hypothetical protein
MRDRQTDRQTDSSSSSTRLILAIIGVVINFTFTPVFADTGPYFAGDPVGGGTDFTCDDDPCNPTCAEEDTSPWSLQELSESTNALLDELSSAVLTPEDCVKTEHTCKLSSNIKSFDKCIWSGKGPDCKTLQSGERKCCEHPVTANVPDKTKCTCSGVRRREGRFSKEDNERCADCMCLAEMSGEPVECKKLMYCVLRFDAESKNPSDPDAGLCEGALGSSPGNPDSWRYSSARCTCDRSTGPTDDRGKNAAGTRGFNQAFCDCVEDKPLTGAQKKQLEECRKARKGADCKGSPWDHYAVGDSSSACPCRSDRIQATRVCGDHIFCDCVQPTPTPTPAG